MRMHTMRTFALVVSRRDGSELSPSLLRHPSIDARVIRARVRGHERKPLRGTDRFVPPSSFSLSPQLALVLAYDAAIAFAAYEASQGEVGTRKLLFMPQQQPTLPGEAIGNAVGTFVTNAGGVLNGAMDMLWPVANTLWEPVSAFSY